MTTTRQMIADGLRPLEATAGGRPAGDRGDRRDFPWIASGDWVPPAGVQQNAEEGLALRAYAEEELGRSRPGGTAIGVARAVQLRSGRPVWPRTIQRMRAYFSRHQGDAKASDWGNVDRPSPGFVAWQLWGGDEGRQWAERIYAQMQQRRNPGGNVDFWIEEKPDGSWHLARLVVPPNERKSGLGSEFMADLVNRADREHRIVTVTPSVDFGASSLRRLERFYGRFGFVKNRGRNRDYSISETMYRIPISRNPASVPATDNSDLLYHVTYLHRLPGIQVEGLVPGQPSAFAGTWYAGYSSGWVFLTEFDGIGYWSSRLEEHALANTDNPEEGWAPVVLAVSVGNLELVEDPEGTRDARTEAWKTQSPIETERLLVWTGWDWVLIAEVDAASLNQDVLDNSEEEFEDDGTSWWDINFETLIPEDEPELYDLGEEE